MRRWIPISLAALMLVETTGAPAEPPSRTTPPTTMASAPSHGAYELLSPGHKRIAAALFEAQKSPTGDAAPLTRDQIAEERRSGKSWGDVFQTMKSQGLIQAESLAQVLGRYNRSRHSRS
jgi:hypothetical protein